VAILQPMAMLIKPEDLLLLRQKKKIWNLLEDFVTKLELALLELESEIVKVLMILKLHYIFWVL
jgi:hypothetical protein